MRKHTITFKVDASTYRWLKALASSQGHIKHDAGEDMIASLMEHAAWCFADNAGRRPGSWEASVAENMLIGGGYNPSACDEEAEKCRRIDARNNAAWRAKNAALAAPNNNTLAELRKEV